MNNKIFKKSQEELIQYLQFKRRGCFVEVKKGKGSKYKRSKEKKSFQEEI